MSNGQPTIVCLGWGSLVWDPDTLPIQRTDPIEAAWSHDGPLLPVELARQSSGNRITLVLVPGREAVPVLWAPLLVSDLEEAKTSLALRECRRKGSQRPSTNTVRQFVDNSCGWWSIDSSKGSYGETIGDWAVARGIAGVVWTDLPPRFNGTKGQTPSGEQVVEFLRGLVGEELENAKKYVTRTPRQIRTAYRETIERELGWLPNGKV